MCFSSVFCIYSTGTFVGVGVCSTPGISLVGAAVIVEVLVKRGSGVDGGVMFGASV